MIRISGGTSWSGSKQEPTPSVSPTDEYLAHGMGSPLLNATVSSAMMPIWNVMNKITYGQ